MLRQRSFAEAVRSIIIFLDVSPQVMLRKTYDAAFIVHTAHPHLRFFAEFAPSTESAKSMPHNNECRLRIVRRMEQDQEGREGLKREQQRQDRHLERAVARSTEEDPAVKRPEEEHKRKLRRD